MLTETEIKSLEPDAAARLGERRRQFHLRIAPSDRRAWIWRTKRHEDELLHDRRVAQPAPSRPRGPSLRGATAVDNWKSLCYPRDRLP